MILSKSQQFKMYMNKKSIKPGDRFIVQTFRQERIPINNNDENKNKTVKYHVNNIPIKGEFIIISRDVSSITVKCLECGTIIAPPISFATICNHIVINEVCAWSCTTFAREAPKVRICCHLFAF